jgi:uncharacterized protein (TIGR03086 family)
MDGADIFKSGLLLATTVVKQVRPDQFANDTPDSEWNVRDLIGHMLNELCWVPAMLAGSTIDEVGDRYDGDLIGDTDTDLSVTWQEAADKAETATDEADLEDTAHLSYGDVTNEEYLRDEGIDQLIHAWDLGKSIGVPVHFDVVTAQIVYDTVLPKQAMLAQSGLFAKPLTVPDTADLQTRLLALFGRDAGWVATA